MTMETFTIYTRLVFGATMILATACVLLEQLGAVTAVVDVGEAQLMAPHEPVETDGATKEPAGVENPNLTAASRK
jgi:hypothetical protein